MKRAGSLFDRIWSLENLREATAKALRGKRDRSEVRKFIERLDTNLEALGEEICSGTGSLGKIHQFIVHDPKKRLISAPCFRERVIHHAVMNVCEPVLESFAIFDSYACRAGNGQVAAIARAEHFAGRHRWFLKLDIRRYFDSAPKDRLLEKLARRFREKRLLTLVERILWSFEPGRSHGLPIGALTSQHFANFYLGYLDRFAKEQLRIVGYVRYMDDFVAWNDDRTREDRPVLVGPQRMPGRRFRAVHLPFRGSAGCNC